MMDLKKQNCVERYKGIVGKSSEIEKIYETLDLFENYESSILIEGESGTGKELLAATIHYNSPRRNNLFVIQSCSAISDTHLDSALFGGKNTGLFEISDGGTLFLDEIGDMCLDVQEKLLRVLESGTFYRKDNAEQQNVNTRIIVATNKDLKSRVEQGLFRRDLYYRINTLHFTMPTLREREEDIIILTNHFLESYAEIHDVDKKEINHDVIRLLRTYNWPGNVRELKNVVERMIIASGTKKAIELNHAPKEIMSTPKVADIRFCIKDYNNLRDILKLLERKIIEEKLESASWNKTLASTELGISRSSLLNRIAKYNLQ